MEGAMRKILKEAWFRLVVVVLTVIFYFRPSPLWEEIMREPEDDKA
jgi:hypothetical protein